MISSGSYPNVWASISTGDIPSARAAWDHFTKTLPKTTAYVEGRRFSGNATFPRPYDALLDNLLSIIHWTLWRYGYTPTPSPTEFDSWWSILPALDKAAQKQSPRYFLAPPLCEALLRTEPPPDTEPYFKLPFQSFYIQLPVGLVRLGELDITQILVAQREHREEFQLPLPLVNEIHQGAGLPLPAQTRAPSQYFVGEVPTSNLTLTFYHDNSLLFTPQPHGTLSLPLAGDRPLTSLLSLGDTLNSLPSDPSLKIDNSRTLLLLVVNTVCLLNSRPELAPTEHTLMRAPRERHGKLKGELWSPAILGADYALRTTSTSSGGEPSPDDRGLVRPHWRRGHWRQQRHGPSLTQHRLLWIEPVLVNADLAQRHDYHAMPPLMGGACTKRKPIGR
ncbi:hypothetical protein [Oleiharenicola sp. Vm1]|uniref:hypothetical protein n=1 Tax=Oleiharenicola sp. Vm1 TaxID=3398393 RepID=UPI0039F4F8FF